MNIPFLLNITQIVITILLIIAILLQQRGGGLSGAFGGGGGSMVSSRRGIEKKVFIASIVLSTLFILTALIRFFI